MFCPKCGAESVEGQRFCKACGTNLQLIHDALGSGNSPQGPFGINVEQLAKNAKDFADSWKTSWSAGTQRSGGQRVVGLKIDNAALNSVREARRKRREAREEIRRLNLPKPREYMSYSWQRNLRNGLLSLFWGAGFGVLLYYLSQTAINERMIRQLEESSNGHVHGLEPVVRMIWLLALLPIMKGLAQIIYAAFFGESMATLTARFTPPPALPEPSYVLKQDTAPVAEEATSQPYEPSAAAPPSVTEHTTHIFE